MARHSIALDPAREFGFVVKGRGMGCPLTVSAVRENTQSWGKIRVGDDLCEVKATTICDTRTMTAESFIQWLSDERSACVSTGSALQIVVERAVSSGVVEVLDSTPDSLHASYMQDRPWRLGRPISTVLNTARFPAESRAGTSMSRYVTLGSSTLQPSAELVAAVASPHQTAKSGAREQAAGGQGESGPTRPVAAIHSSTTRGRAAALLAEAAKLRLTMRMHALEESVRVLSPDTSNGVGDGEEGITAAHADAVTELSLVRAQLGLGPPENKVAGAMNGTLSTTTRLIDNDAARPFNPTASDAPRVSPLRTEPTRDSGTVTVTAHATGGVPASLVEYEAGLRFLEARLRLESERLARREQALGEIASRVLGKEKSMGVGGGVMGRAAPQPLPVHDPLPLLCGVEKDRINPALISYLSRHQDQFAHMGAVIYGHAELALAQAARSVSPSRTVVHAHEGQPPEGKAAGSTGLSLSRSTRIPLPAFHTPPHALATAIPPTLGDVERPDAQEDEEARRRAGSSGHGRGRAVTSVVNAPVALLQEGDRGLRLISSPPSMPLGYSYNNDQAREPAAVALQRHVRNASPPGIIHRYVTEGSADIVGTPDFLRARPHSPHPVKSTHQGQGPVRAVSPVMGSGAADREQLSQGNGRYGVYTH